MMNSSSRLPRVAVLATGGTIAGQADAQGNYRAGELAVDSLLAALPGLSEISEPVCETVFALDSKDMTPEHWLVLAARAREWLARDEVDGLVITHGTDTLEETAWFLALCLPRSKPVIFAAAMRPAGVPSADGPMNLLQAFAAASTPALAGCGPLIVANDRLWPARHFCKRDSLAVDGLGSFSAAPVARLRGCKLLLDATPPTFATCFGGALPSRLPRVDIILGYAGAPAESIDWAVAAGALGLVLALPGHGSVPQSWNAAIARAVTAGVCVVRASRVPTGGVVPGANFDDAYHRTLACGPFSALQTRVLLSLALAHHEPPASIENLLTRA